MTKYHDNAPPPRRRVLFRCDAGALPEIGTGHVRRCLALARAVRDLGQEVRFLTRELPVAATMVRDAGFSTLDMGGFREGTPEERALKAALRSWRPDMVVFDELDTRSECIRACHDHGAVVATFDDRGAGQDADIWINGILEAPGVPYVGPDYVVLPSADTPPGLSSTDQPGVDAPGARVFLSFGGYDHLKLAQRAVDALRDLGGVDRIVVAAPQHDGNAPQAGQGVDVHLDTPYFQELIAASDIAVVGGGLSVFQAMLAGTPAIVVAQYPHQVETGDRYEDRGAVVNLGLPGDNLEDRLRSEVARLLADREARQRMSRRGRDLVDGEGLQRVVDLLRVWTATGDDGGRFLVGRLTPALVNLARREARAHGIKALRFTPIATAPGAGEEAKTLGLEGATDGGALEMRIGAGPCIAVVQARMGSSRLPGKVLAGVGGRSVLACLVERAGRAKNLDALVVATTTDPQDDAIAAWCADHGVPCHRGDQHDVLDRYHQVARATGAGRVVRLTSDCPLLDPNVVDAVVDFFAANGLDYAANTVPPEGCTYPDGMDVEVFSLHALERAWREANLPSEREHVTFHFWKNPKRFRTGRLDLDEDLSGPRLTVDYPEDLDLVREIVGALGPDLDFTMMDIVNHLREHPDLVASNTHVERNAGWKPALAADAETLGKTPSPSLKEARS